MGSWADVLGADLLLRGSGSGFLSGAEVVVAAREAAAHPSGPISVGPQVIVLNTRSQEGTLSLGAGAGRALRYSAPSAERAIVFVGPPGSTSPLVGTALAAAIGAAAVPASGAGQATFSSLRSAVSDCHALLCAFTCAAGLALGADSAPVPGRLQHACLWSVSARLPRLDRLPSPPSVSVQMPLVSRSAAGSEPSCAKCWAATLFAPLLDDPAAKKRQRAQMESGRDALRRLCGRARLSTDETDRLLATVNACMRLSEVRWYVLPGQQSPAALADEPAARALRAAAANLCVPERELRAALGATAGTFSPAAAADEVYSRLLRWMVEHVNRVLEQAAEDDSPATGTAASAPASLGKGKASSGVHGRPGQTGDEVCVAGHGGQGLGNNAGQGPSGDAGCRRVLFVDLAQPGGAGEDVTDSGLDGLLASLLLDGVSELTATHPRSPHGGEPPPPPHGACELEVELCSAAQSACRGLCASPSLLALRALAAVAEASAWAAGLTSADAVAMQRALAEARTVLLDQFGTGRRTGAEGGGGGTTEVEVRSACGGPPARYFLSGEAVVLGDGPGRGGAGLLDQAAAAWHTCGGATALQGALRHSSSPFVLSLLQVGAGSGGLSPGRQAKAADGHPHSGGGAVDCPKGAMTRNGPNPGTAVCPWATLPGRAASVFATLARLSACDQLRTVVCGLAGGSGKQAAFALDPVAWLTAYAQRTLQGKPYSAPVSVWQSRYAGMLPRGAGRGGKEADKLTAEALLHALGVASAEASIHDGQVALTVSAMRAVEARLATANSLAVDVQARARGAWARATAAELSFIRASRRLGASCIQAAWHGLRDRRVASHLRAARAARWKAAVRLAVSLLQAHARGLAARTARRCASAARTLQSVTRGRASRQFAAAVRFAVTSAPARRTFARWLRGWLIRRRLARLRRCAIAIQAASRAALQRWGEAGIRASRADYHERRHTVQRQLAGLRAQVAAAAASGGHAKAMGHRLTVKEYQARLGKIEIGDLLAEWRRWKAGGGSPRADAIGGRDGTSGGSASANDAPAGGLLSRQPPIPAVSVSLDHSPPLSRPRLVDRTSGTAAAPTQATGRRAEEMLAGAEAVLGLVPQSDMPGVQRVGEREAAATLEEPRAAGRGEPPDAGQVGDGAEGGAAAPRAGVRAWSQPERKSSASSGEGTGAVVEASTWWGEGTGVAAGTPDADAVPAEAREALRIALASIKAHATDPASSPGEPRSPGWRGGGLAGLDEQTLSRAVSALRADAGAGHCSEARRYALRKQIGMLGAQLRRLQDDREQVERACAARRPRGRAPRVVAPPSSHVTHAADGHGSSSGTSVVNAAAAASPPVGKTQLPNHADHLPAQKPTSPRLVPPASLSAHYSADAASTVRAFLQTGRWAHAATRRRPARERPASSPALALRLRSPPRRIECSPTQRFELRSSPSKQRPIPTNFAKAASSPALALRLHSPPRRIECSPTQKFELRSSPSKRRARLAAGFRGAVTQSPAAPFRPAAPACVREPLRYSPSSPIGRRSACRVPADSWLFSFSACPSSPPPSGPVGSPRHALAWKASRRPTAAHSPADPRLAAASSRRPPPPRLQAHCASPGAPLGAPNGGNPALRKLAPPSFHRDVTAPRPADAPRSTPLRPRHQALVWCPTSQSS
jgi:hypothetical protein